MVSERQPTVLIIEDDPSLRDALQRALRGQRYRILEAGKGGEGMKMLQAHPVDVVLVDIFMPGQKEKSMSYSWLRRWGPIRLL